MLDDMVLNITNLIAREGLTGETPEMLAGLLSTLLSMPDMNDPAGRRTVHPVPFDRVNITNVQTLLLLLGDFELPSTLKRLTNELRCRVIRLSLGEYWEHGVVVNTYNLLGMNKHLLTREETVTVYEDGFIDRRDIYALNGGFEKDGAIFNDYAALLFDGAKRA